MNKEKFEFTVKSIAKTIAAVTIVAIGVRLLTVYLTDELDLVSIIAGILGILILQPTIKHYTRLINLLFPDNTEDINQEQINSPKTKSDSLDEVDKIRKTFQKK